jgi:hypothetical protein
MPATKKASYRAMAWRQPSPFHDLHSLHVEEMSFGLIAFVQMFKNAVVVTP